MRVLLVILLAAYAAAHDENVWDFDMDEPDEIDKLLQTKEDIITFLTEGRDDLEKVSVTSFSFKDCGGAAAMTTISSVSVTPDPIAFPGPINIAASFQIKKDFGMPLSGDLLIEKKLFGKYIKVPCVDNIGSCSYSGLCGDLEKVTCPDQLVKIGIDCKCPFKANSYSLPNTEFDVSVSLPLPSGDYHIRGTATSNGTVAACLDLIFTLK